MKQLSKRPVNTVIKDKKSEIVVYDSPVGLGEMFMQDSKNISYASRTLGHVESRHSQTEI